jgi:hypothetical protein
MKPQQDVREFLGLQDTKTGELVRFDENYNHDEYPALTDDDSKPYFECPDEDRLSMVLFENTPSYNANRNTPSWGPFKREQLAPVRVRVTVDVEPVTLTEPVSLKTQSIREIPYPVARSYAGGDFERDEQLRVVFWLAHVPDGKTLQDLQALEGQFVYGGDRYTRRRLYKALPVPEDYVDLFEGKPGALLLASSYL